MFLIRLIVLFFIFITFPSRALAAVNPTSGSTTVNASVPSFSFATADLIAPANNSTTNNPQINFHWERPSPIPDYSPLNHYDLYLDGSGFATNIPDNLTSQTYYFYTASASANNFYVNLTTDLTQGYHTWYVIAYTDAGTTSTTGTWTFYLDSTSPTITVTSVDGQSYTTATTYTVSTQNPLLKGTVEANANLTLALDSGQTYTGNYPSGTWEHQFNGLVRDTTYTVYLTSTDAGGNTYSHPSFYLVYGQPSTTPTPTSTPTSTPTPTLTITPTPSTIDDRPSTTPSPIPSTTPTATPSGLPLPTATLTPPPDLLTIITPTTFIPKPPTAPTPPPPKIKLTATHYETGKILFYLLLLFGLPLHLLMSFIGTQTPLSFIFSFFFTLGFPFLKKKTNQTFPFTNISFYLPNNLKKPWMLATSDVSGWYNLPEKLPETLFIILTSPLKIWKNMLLKNQTLLNSCLYPINKRILSQSEKLSSTIYNLRSIPLVIALITSTAGLYLFPNFFVLTYFYLTVQYSFSEYLYPKIIK